MVLLASGDLSDAEYEWAGSNQRVGSRHCVITLPNNPYPLNPILCIGVPETNTETIATSPFVGKSHDVLD